MEEGQKGQVILILVLVMMVALSVGLAISQRSITDISISTKTEQSTRALSAAEAGIESAINIEKRTGAPPQTVPLINFQEANKSEAGVTVSRDLPGTLQALGYPAIGKADFAQFWLADPVTTPPSTYYNQDNFDIYFGNSSASVNEGLTPGFVARPAIEVNVISLFGGSYVSQKFFYDSNTSSSITNSFTVLNNSGCNDMVSLSDDYLNDSIEDAGFFCRVNVSGLSGTPVLARVRILRTDTKQRIALKPTGTCDPPASQVPCSLPPQAVVYKSTGKSGLAERKLRVMRVNKVVPHLLDFTIFAQGDLRKQR